MSLLEKHPGKIFGGLLGGVIALFVLWATLREFGFFGESPQRLATISLDRTYAQLKDEVDIAGGQTSDSGDSELEIKISSRRYREVTVYWRSNPTHPVSFSLRLAGLGFGHDPATEARLSRALNGGLDAHQSWQWKGLSIGMGGPTITVAVSRDESPNWTKQLDAAWKVVFGAAFEVPVVLSAAERDLMGGAPVGDRHVGHP